MNSKEPRVLLVDDEPDFLDDYSYFLRDKGLSIRTASSVGEALDLLFSQPFDLVLLDLKMPSASGSELGGLEILQALRRRQPQSRVVVITSHTSQRTGSEVERLGVFDQLHKPIDETDLRTVVDRALADVESRARPFVLEMCPIAPYSPCNRQSEIMTEYSPHRVFVNVPTDGTYEDRAEILREALMQRNTEPVFAEESIGSGMILCSICKAMQTSHHAITDISLRDPNVMYWLGLMHAVGLSSLLLKHQDEAMPRHLSGLVCLEYQSLREFRTAIARWADAQLH